jgi:hypothetical protein
MLRTHNDEDIEDTVGMDGPDGYRSDTFGNEVMMRIVWEYFGVDWNIVG